MTKPNLTVLIATVNRPAFLRTALASVARQTARDRIHQVIVSENSGQRDSEAVCAEFESLPLVYRFRSPPLSLIEHASRLLTETETPYMASLHDDDWWHPEHLANGLKFLDAEGGRASYWASFLRVSSESSAMLHSNSSFWAGAGYRPLTETWKLGPKEAILASLWHTPAHYSSLITRTDMFALCVQMLAALNNPFDNDRIVVTELAKMAPLYFNPIPELCVRYHQSSETARLEGMRSRYIEATTHYLLDEAEALGLDVKAELENLMLTCPPGDRAFIYDSFEKGARRALRQRDQLPPTLKRHLARTRIQRYAKGINRRVNRYKRLLQTRATAKAAG